MKDGFIKVAAANTEIKVAEVEFNKNQILSKINRANKNGVELLVLPELCLTSASCGDIFNSATLIETTVLAIKEIRDYTKELDICVVIGAPVSYKAKVFNAAVVIKGGKILGIVPKKNIKNTVFCSGSFIKNGSFINLFGQEVPFGNDIVFASNTIGSFTFSVALGDDLFDPNLPFTSVITNPAANYQTASSFELTKQKISVYSAIKQSSIIYSNAAYSESTTDYVYGGDCLIAENLSVLACTEPFESTEITETEIDTQLISALNKEKCLYGELTYRTVFFEQGVKNTPLHRTFSKNPFIPFYQNEEEYFKNALNIQVYGLKKRLSHTKTNKMVLGISGGLDSTLALLVCVRVADLMGINRKNVCAFTLPCFGTTNRTKSNAVTLCELLGVSIEEINITDAVNLHLKDIKQPNGVYDAAYENSQARERTQVLMDLANRLGGILVGTGDLSELALGWATYGGDQMSMYSLNGSVPKTLVRGLVSYEANRIGGETEKVLLDIVDTPVSPELLPSNESGDISQKTEDLVGPYELHDFFIYYFVGYGFSPKKIFRMALIAFKGVYTPETIKKWLAVFVRRFFAQQFKRSCMPDGPKVTDISLSPRGSFNMPSDACADIWLKEIDSFKGEI